MKQSKNIVITGASTGIGYATTKALVKKGYRVFGSVRKQTDAQKLQQEFGTQFEPLLFDVTQEEQVYKEAQRVAQLIGDEGLFALINNAGIAVGGPLMHLPLEELRWQMEVNVIGLMCTTKAFLPLLGAKKNCPYPAGKVINISSVAGKISNPFMGPYCASKHAVEALSNALRIELLLYGIDVVVIGPGVVKTPIWDKADSVDFEPYQTTDYHAASQKFKHFIDTVSTQGFEQDEFGEMLAKIVTTSKPKPRYPLVYGKFTNWILPRLLPTRFLNKIIGMRLGFLK